MKIQLCLVFVGIMVTLTEGLPGKNGGNIFGGKSVSYRSYGPISWGHSDSHFVNPNKKRYIGLPEGSSLGVKWAMNLPFNTFTIYKGTAVLALPMKVPLPDYLYSEHKYEYLHDKQKDRTRRAAREERTYVYKYLQAAFDKLGLDGNSCVLRVICDIAEAPLADGLLGDIINIFLTASSAGGREFAWEEPSYQQYVEAESWGQVKGRCERRYKTCPESPLSVIPQLLQNIIGA